MWLWLIAARKEWDGSLLSILSIHPFQGDFAQMDFHLSRSTSLNVPLSMVRLYGRACSRSVPGSSSSRLNPSLAAALASLLVHSLPWIPSCLDTQLIISCLWLCHLSMSHSLQALCTKFRRCWAGLALWLPRACITAWLSSLMVAMWAAHSLLINSAANITPTTSASWVV